MQETYRYCEALVREADKDRYLATLLAPETAQRHLFALYAFNVELSLVGDRARDPLAGEVRLQWWREALTGKPHGEIEANPVASAILETSECFGLSQQCFEQLISARMFDLFSDPMPTVAALDIYLQGSTSSLFYLAAKIAGTNTDNTDIACDHAGIAYGLTQLLRNLPFHASRGKVYLPQDVLAETGVEINTLLQGRADKHLKTALLRMRQIAREQLDNAKKYLAPFSREDRFPFLPLALVGPYLDLMDRADYDPFKTPVENPQWKRQWILWRAARKLR